MSLRAEQRQLPFSQVPFVLPQVNFFSPMCERIPSSIFFSCGRLTQFYTSSHFVLSVLIYFGKIFVIFQLLRFLERGLFIFRDRTFPRVTPFTRGLWSPFVHKASSPITPPPLPFLHTHPSLLSRLPSGLISPNLYISFPSLTPGIPRPPPSFTTLLASLPPLCTPLRV